MMNPTLAIILVGALAFIVVCGLGLAITWGDSSSQRAVKRAQNIAGARRDDQRGRAQAANTAETRRKQIQKSLDEQERRQKKTRQTLSSKLQQAGLSVTVPQYAVGSTGIGAGVAIVAFLIHTKWIIALAFGGASAILLPYVAVGFLAGQRKNKFTAAFADAMDVIVRGIKSGLPIHDCLRIIGQETAEPLAGEFRRLVENIAMGMTMDQGLDKLYERMPTPEVRFFSIVMNIQQKAGGNLSEALGNLSSVLRARKLMKEKVKALSAEATSSAMIIGCLPPGVVLLINIMQPSYMSTMFTDPRGHIMIGAAIALMSIGSFVMYRMINFKF
jgi:tight adherence protein B